ncbi:hypothetical protein [Marinobacter caseinilyticus]|uniref:hypothetical protein n=1 Tax=Marinobacter caseinilyticus TaxID=2692195 RepID=UPI001A93DA7E|nr:hypothetical protein [Marinobacter caseinilyticus]
MRTENHQCEILKIAREAVSAYSTEEVAMRYGVQPGSIRASLCRKGHWCGIRPIKLPNRFLAWPADVVDQLLAGAPTGSQKA